MEINQILDAIEQRIEAHGVKAQAILMEIDRSLEMTVGVAIDPSKLSYAVMESVAMFNDEATNTIEFISGKIVNNGADNALFMLMFNVSKCNGGL